MARAKSSRGTMWWVGDAARYRATGSIEVSDRLVERFWSNVRCTDSIRDCWEWTGQRNASGYGVLSIKGRNVAAHRFAHLIADRCRDIPEGVVVRHMCDNPPCCNPKHLRLGSYFDNQQDADLSHELLVISAKQRGVEPPLRRKPADPAKDGRRFRRGEKFGHGAVADEVALAIRHSYWNLSRDPRALAGAFALEPWRVSNILFRGSYRHLPVVDGEPTPDDDGRVRLGTDRAEAARRGWAERKARAATGATAEAT